LSDSSASKIPIASFLYRSTLCSFHEFFVLSAPMYRSQRHDELQNKSTLGNGSYLDSRLVFPESRSVGCSSVSTKASNISLERKLQDLNISTSYIPGETDSDKTDSPLVDHSKSTVSLGVVRSPPEAPEIEAFTQTDDLRKTILNRIGLLYDSNYLTTDETAEAIGLAMQRDDTCDLMASLLSARSSVDGQGQFMKMWIATRMRQKQQLYVPPQSVTPFMPSFSGSHLPHAEMVFRPKPVYFTNPRIDTPEEDISQISLQTMVRSDEPPRPSPPPNPSPPLFPTVLQFNDPMFHRTGYTVGPTPLAHYVGGTKISSCTPSSCSTGTPLDPLLMTTNNNSIGDNHGII